MNHLLFFPEDKISDNEIQISDHRKDHLLEVLKLKNGDRIKVGEWEGKTGSGTVKSIGENVHIEFKLSKNPPEKIPLHVIIGLCRPKVLSRLITDLTTYGVEKIDIIRTWYGDKGYWNNDLFTEKGLRTVIAKGLEQAMDTIPPVIKLVKRFGPYSNDILPTYSDNSRCYIAQPNSENELGMSKNERSVIAIGPERGFTPYEVKQFIKAGFEPVNLGNRILRTESAAHFAVSRLS
jgi:RsmE family RNA methyltransferase